MYRFDIRGNIVSDREGEMYSYFGMSCTYPSQVRKFLKQIPENSEITVTVNSGGGDVYAGSEIYTLLKSYKGNIIVDVYGIAASAAATIAVAGNKVRMSPTALLMIHNPATATQGDQNAHRKSAETLEKVTESIANAYVAKTGKSLEEIKELMNITTYFTAQEAINNGFADEILFETDTAVNNSGHNYISNSEKLQERYENLKRLEMQNTLSELRNKIRG